MHSKVYEMLIKTKAIININNYALDVVGKAVIYFDILERFLATYRIAPNFPG